MVKEAVGGRRRSGKARVVDQTAGMAERASMPLNICLSDPQGRDEAQNSEKKGVHFWGPSIEVSVHAGHEVLTRRSPVGHPSLTLAHPARKVRMFKAAWCG